MLERLDIAVNYPFLVAASRASASWMPMSIVRGIGRRRGDDSVKGLAFEQFHGDERASIVLFDGVNDANAGMIERGGGASFAEEAFKRLRIAAGIFGEEFQRDAPAKLGVLSFVDDTHASAAKFAEDTVVGDCFVKHGREAKRGW